MEETIQNASQSGIEIYVAPDNSIQLQVKLDQDTVWLTVDQMAMLFDRDVKTIRKHINNALREELDKSLVVAKFASTKKYGRREGYMQEVEIPLYNLDVIISVGYRVKSQRGVQFRQWANKVLKEYLVKGYAVRTNMQLQQYQELKPNEIYQKIVQIGRFFCLYLCMSQKSSNFARHFE